MKYPPPPAAPRRPPPPPAAPAGAIAHISKRALGRAPQAEVRLAALHALASIAGAERAGDSKRRDDAVLGGAAEDTLRSAVYSAAAFAPGGRGSSCLRSPARAPRCRPAPPPAVPLADPTACALGPPAGAQLPAEVVASLLEQPFADSRRATYRLALALAFRPWFAAHLLSCQGLAERLLDPSSETGERRCCLVAAACSSQPLPWIKVQTGL
jgi:hypothetical protein